MDRHEWKLPFGTASVTRDTTPPRFTLDVSPGSSGLFRVETLLKEEILRLAEREKALIAANLHQTERYLKAEAALAERVKELETAAAELSTKLQETESDRNGYKLENMKAAKRIAVLEEMQRQDRAFALEVESPLLGEIRLLRQLLEAADRRNGELAGKVAVLGDRLDVAYRQIAEFQEEGQADEKIGAKVLAAIEENKHLHEMETALAAANAGWERAIRRNVALAREIVQLKEAAAQLTVDVDYWRRQATRNETSRSAKLLALLDSEEPPEGLYETVVMRSETESQWRAAWRWLREQVGEHRPHPGPGC